MHATEIDVLELHLCSLLELTYWYSSFLLLESSSLPNSTAWSRAAHLSYKAHTVFYLCVYT